MIPGNWYKVHYTFPGNPSGFVIVRCKYAINKDEYWCELKFGNFKLPKDKNKNYKNNRVIEAFGRVGTLTDFKNKFPEYFI